ncbi:MAG TPA: hypothetical protein VF132_01620 [Rudaea sp.]
MSGFCRGFQQSTHSSAHQGRTMATVNYSVPEHIKSAFNSVFRGYNKSALIAQLMQEAVEREHRRRLHIAAMDSILKRRAELPLEAAAPRAKERKHR